MTNTIWNQIFAPIDSAKYAILSKKMNQKLSCSVIYRSGFKGIRDFHATTPAHDGWEMEIV